MDVSREFDKDLCSTFTAKTPRGKLELAKERELVEDSCFVRDHEEARLLHQRLNAKCLLVVT